MAVEARDRGLAPCGEGSHRLDATVNKWLLSERRGDNGLDAGCSLVGATSAATQACGGGNGLGAAGSDLDDEEGTDASQGNDGGSARRSATEAAQDRTWSGDLGAENVDGACGSKNGEGAGGSSTVSSAEDHSGASGNDGGGSEDRRDEKASSAARDNSPAFAGDVEREEEGAG